MEKAKKLDYFMANVRADLNVKGCGMAHPIKTQKMETMYVLLTSHCKTWKACKDKFSSLEYNTYNMIVIKFLSIYRVKREEAKES